MSTLPPYANVAFYKFVRIDDPQAERVRLLTRAESLGLHGTILLAHEGINSCFVGTHDAVDAMIGTLRDDPRFADIDFKKSYSETVPFHRMLVKVKSEIVTMGKPGIEPAHFTGDYVEPLELKAWLDAGEDIVLVDTRNDYEVRLGTFHGAVNPDIKTFRTFPEWVENTLGEKRAAKVVTFCTGGIRCEKATAYMRQNGFESVYQLRGGILKYFEETMAAGVAPTEEATHYDGACFVFDYRVAVDRTLAPAPGHTLCYVCRSPLTAEDLASPHYIAERQCPHCVGKEEAREEKLRTLQEKNSAAALERRRERSRAVKAERMRSLQR